MNELFVLLDPTVRKWVYKQGWADLHDIQKKAIKPILAARSDLIISASTAAGKTEAAFLPACTAIADETSGFGILYISPLKALINDQYRRLEELCEMLGMRVTPWHGDSSETRKRDAKRSPEGILLITPESLESLLIRESGWVSVAFGSLKYVIIDEFHAFIGSERGCHLKSLLNRLDCLLVQKRPVPRIALSATLGDLDEVPGQLRPSKSLPCKIITGSGRSYLRVQVRGYVDRTVARRECPVDRQIAGELYDVLRGDTNLVFANSRQRTEHFTVILSDLCEENLVPNEFFSHHGSLSKELRSSLETRLQKQKLPTTAVCTMTLELGIDIGKVKSVAQITAPHSVSSLRQRLGRSGRRGNPAILRMFISENELNQNSSVIDKLRIELLQSAAMIRLLVNQKWNEPVDGGLFHFSTLLHQILAVIAQWGGVRADQLWSILCKSGTFINVTIEQFKMLLFAMAEKRLIVQMGSGELALGDQGENTVGHYSFYPVFKSPEEFRIEVNGKTLGNLPITSPVIPGQHIVFGGRRWEVKDIDDEKRVIRVIPSASGKPLSFGGDGISIHDYVRQEMLKIYLDGDYRIEVGGSRPEFMDSVAKQLFFEGLGYFRDLKLQDTRIICSGGQVYLISWMGDKVVNTLTVLLISQGYKASCFAGVIEIEDADHLEISRCLKTFAKGEKPNNSELAGFVRNKQTEKYDHLLPESLLNVGYGAKAFDVDRTADWIIRADEMNYL